MTNSNKNRLEHQEHLLRGLAQDRYALKITSRLSDVTETLPRDISERLRAARVQAVSKRKVSNVRTASNVVASGSSAALTYGNEGFSLWNRIASAIPLIALVVGLVAINMVQNDNRASEVAEVDEALLTDPLPPAAYIDPGFAQFLKSMRDPSQ